MPKVSIFPNIQATKNGEIIELEEVYNQIKDGKWQDDILQYRILLDKKGAEKAGRLKSALPYFTGSGVFKERKVEGLLTHSERIVIDIDKIQKIDALKELIALNDYTEAIFVSVSGAGLAVVVKIPDDDHLSSFMALEQYYKRHFNVNIDQSCKDVSRARFISYDPDLRFNPDAEVFKQKFQKPDTRKEKVPAAQQSFKTNGTNVTDDDYRWNWLLEDHNKRYEYREGTRHNYCLALALKCNAAGMDHNFCLSQLTHFFEVDSSKRVNDKEMKDLVAFAYKNVAAHGSFVIRRHYNQMERRVRNELIQQDKSSEVEEMVASVTGTLDCPAELVTRMAEAYKKEPEYEIQGKVFWFETQITQTRAELSIHRASFIEFLQDHGYCRLDIGGTTAIAQVIDKVIKLVHIEQIMDYVNDWLDDLPDQLPKAGGYRSIQLRELIYQKHKFLFSESFLTNLKLESYDFKQENYETAYFYYNNCFIRVTPSEITTHPYRALDGYIWESQKIPRDFNFQDKVDKYDKVEDVPDIIRFFTNICNGIDERLSALMGMTGYLLHSYKNPSIIPAVILIDENISDDPEGGTGKGIFYTALSHMKKSVGIDGKNFNFDNNFAFSRVDPDTQILSFQDVTKKFDFSRIHSILSDGITVEKKGVNAFHVPFKRSPKILITTNFIIEGYGATNERRMKELEFYPHYNPSLTPYDEFGHLLFDDWDDIEWMKFDNFMMWCCQNHLDLLQQGEHGFVPYQSETLKERKLEHTARESIREWMTSDTDSRKARKMEAQNEGDPPQLSFAASDEHWFEMDTRLTAQFLYNSYNRYYAPTDKEKIEQDGDKRYFVSAIRRFGKISFSSHFKFVRIKSNNIIYLMGTEKDFSSRKALDSYARGRNVFGDDSTNPMDKSLGDEPLSGI